MPEERLVLSMCVHERSGGSHGGERERGSSFFKCFVSWRDRSIGGNV